MSNKICSIDKESGLIVLVDTDKKLCEYRKKDYEQTLKNIEIFNKEYSYFKTTGKVNKDYIEKLFSMERDTLRLLNSFYFE